MRPSRGSPRRGPPDRRAVAGLCLVLLALVLVLPEAALGAGWTAPRRVTGQAGGRLDSLHQLAATSGALHLVHPRLGSGGRPDRVVHQRSRDGGRTWSTERALFTSSGGRAVVPNLALAGRGAVLVAAWRVRGSGGSTLYVRTSRDGGARFGPRVAVARTGPGSGIGVPAVAVGDGVIAVAWTSRAPGVVKVSRSRDGGRTFGQARSLGRTGLSISCRSQVTDGLVGLAAAGRRIHAAWSVADEGRCLARRIVVRSSDDAAETWREARTLTGRVSYGWPELDAIGRSVVATVQLPSGGLLVARSGSAGATWSERVLKPPRRLVRSAGDVLVRPGGEVWVAFVDSRRRRDALAGSRVVARRSTDGGRSFGSPRSVLRDGRLLRQAPNLAATGRQPTVVVQSGRLSGRPRGLLSIRWR